MSIKIPVGETISRSFGFAFRRYLALLGVAWLPMIAMVAIMIFVFVPFLHTMIAFTQYQSQHPGNTDFQAMPIPNFGLILLAELLMLYIYCWMGAGATKEALGLRTGSKFFYLPGADEFNIMITYIATFLICYFSMIGVMIALAIVGLIIGVAMGISDYDPAKYGLLIVPAVLIMIAVVIGYFYALIRAMWLIQPLTIVSKKIDIFGSWRLMKGNVLRAFVISLVMLLPVLVLEIVVYGVAAGSVFASLPPHAEAMKPEEVFALFSTMALRVLPAMGVLGILVMPLFLGFSRAPSAYAYRALVPPPPPTA
jgi:hypothetical protein